MFPSGGHGWGMGNCFSYELSFPPSQYPHRFYENTVLTDNILFGQDFVNGDYISKNAKTWFEPPYQTSSPTNISLDDFYLKYSTTR
jgi:hypothetical protein